MKHHAMSLALAIDRDLDRAGWPTPQKQIHTCMCPSHNGDESALQALCDWCLIAA